MTGLIYDWAQYLNKGELLIIFSSKEIENLNNIPDKIEYRKINFIEQKIDQAPVFMLCVALDSKCV